MKRFRNFWWGLCCALCLPACAVATIEDSATDDAGMEDDSDGAAEPQSTGGSDGSGGTEGTGAEEGVGGSMTASGSGGETTASGGAMTASGGRTGFGSGSGGAAAGPACTNIVPTESDWPAGTCQGWATQTDECDNDWMLEGDDGKGWCNRSCGRCP